MWKFLINLCFLFIVLFHNTCAFAFLNYPVSCDAIVSLGLQALESGCEVLCQYMVVVHINAFIIC